MQNHISLSVDKPSIEKWHQFVQNDENDNFSIIFKILLKENCTKDVIILLKAVERKYNSVRFISICIVLFIFSTLSTRAQSHLDPINLLTPDFPQLERLTFQSVNELRNEKQLPDLVWDNVLERAAKDHADYLIINDKLSHNQSITGKRTPTERVKIHGGLIYTIVGENIIEVPLGVYLPVQGKKVSTITYSSSANTMALAWKASPRHYKNIISSEYNRSAIAVSYDDTNQRLIAVQVFAYSAIPGEQLKQPDYSSELLDIPDQQLPHNLKEYQYNPKNKKPIARFNQLKVDRGYITGSFKAAKKIFKGRRSGLAQEYIPLNQFDSISRDFASVPNRRNGLFELNGQLMEPVYRRKLLKYSRKHWSRDYIIYTRVLKIKEPTKNFIYPLSSNASGWEYNLFLTKYKRLAAYRSYISVPHRLFEDSFPQLNVVNSFKEVIPEQKFRLYNTYDTLHYRIYYAPNVADIQPEKQEEVLKSMASKTGKIINVAAAAYASIEGNKDANQKLTLERMRQFMQLIYPYKDSMVANPKISTREQWTLFQQQIIGTPLDSLKKMKKEEVRNYVNQNKEDSLLSTLLDEQRYMEFTMIWRNDHKEPLPTIKALEVYDSLKSRVDLATRLSGGLINELETAQLALYYELARKDKEMVTLPAIPYLERYPAFQYHELVFRYRVLQNIGDKEFYDELHELVRMKYFPARLKDEAIFNNLVFIYDKYLSGKLEKIINYENLACYKYRRSEFYLRKYKKKKCKNIMTLNPPEYFILKEIRGLISAGKRMKISNFPENELWKYYYLYTIHSLDSFVPTHGEIYSLLPGIKRYYHPVDSVLTDVERLKLSYFYCRYGKYETAKGLVKPIAVRNEPNKEALKLYVTLLYDEFKDEHTYTEMLIKEFNRLGKAEWCDLWFNPDYLNFLLLEDLKLKNFYNCNCGR